MKKPTDAERRKNKTKGSKERLPDTHTYTHTRIKGGKNGDKLLQW